MLVALERLLVPAHGYATPALEETAEPKLNICVVFTSVESTLAALRHAGDLATSLGARITLLALQVVPYPLPLESPPVLLDWNDRRFRAIATESPVETIVRLYLCRDSFETLKSALAPKSVVVIGAGKRWWFRIREKKLARKLRRAGHEVILTETE